MALALVTPVKKRLLTVASTSTTATSAVFTLPLADAYTFYMNVTTATAGTMDTVFLTSIDGGTTFVNVPWRFAQVATTTGCFVLNIRSGVGQGTMDTTAGTAASATVGNGALVTATGGQLCMQAVVDTSNMKFTYTIGTGPYVFTLDVLAWPRGAMFGID